MNKSHMFFFASCAALSLVYADSDSTTTTTTTTTQRWYDAAPYADQWGGCAPYRIAPDHAIFFTGAGLWWEGSNVGEVVGFASKFKVEKKEVEVENRTILLKPEFNWGFRVGAGYQMPYDDWELALDWTHIREQLNAHEHAKKNEHIILGFQEDLEPQIHSVNGHAHVKIDYLDLALRREFLVTRFLGLKPQVGLRNLWFKGKSHAEFGSREHHKERADLRIKTKNNYWGIGPKFGLDTRWMLGWGFSIYGDTALSLLYGRFKLENEGSLEGLELHEKKSRKHRSDVELESSPRSVVPITDLQIGLQWDRLFVDNDLHLNLFVGWEHHVFFQVGQSDVAQLADSNNSNFTTSGLTFGGRLDF